MYLLKLYRINHRRTVSLPFGIMSSRQLILTDTRTSHQDFQTEFTRYINTKKVGRGSDKGCSLCSSAFETQESRETDVIFAPQVFSHKRPINSGQVKRGICQLCKLEMMLRQILNSIPMESCWRQAMRALKSSGSIFIQVISLHQKRLRLSVRLIKV